MLVYNRNLAKQTTLIKTVARYHYLLQTGIPATVNAPLFTISGALVKGIVT